MKFFGDSYDALHILVYNTEEIESYSDRDRRSCLIALFNSVGNTKFFLQNNYYKNEDEKNHAIKVCMRDPNTIAELFLSNKDIFSKEQEEEGLEVIWDNWSAIRILFKGGYFNREQRIRAINVLMPSPNSICSLLTDNKNTLEDEELDLILQYYYVRNDVLKIILKYHKNPVPRKKAFDYGIQNKIDIYDLAKTKKLNNQEMQIVHDIYWGQYFEEIKRTYKDFLDYCEIFIYNLNEIELEYLTKKLMGNKKKSDIQRFANNLPELYKFRLEGYLLADKLRRGG